MKWQQYFQNQKAISCVAFRCDSITKHEHTAGLKQGGPYGRCDVLLEEVFPVSDHSMVCCTAW